MSAPSRSRAGARSQRSIRPGSNVPCGGRRGTRPSARRGRSRRRARRQPSRWWTSTATGAVAPSARLAPYDFTVAPIRRPLAARTDACRYVRRRRRPVDCVQSRGGGGTLALVVPGRCGKDIDLDRTAQPRTVCLLEGCTAGGTAGRRSRAHDRNVFQRSGQTESATRSRDRASQEPCPRGWASSLRPCAQFDRTTSATCCLLRHVNRRCGGQGNIFPLSARGTGLTDQGDGSWSVRSLTSTG